MLGPIADRRRIRIVVNAVDASCWVRADRQRFKQVVVNLVANAVKFNTDGGEVCIDGERRPNEHFRLSISDTGPSIADSDIGRLFQPFERLAADQTQIEGTGLGLALSKHLMTAMAGEIGVTSHSGTGSTFWIEFPITAEPSLTPSDRLDDLIEPAAVPRPPSDPSTQQSPRL